MIDEQILVILFWLFKIYVDFYVINIIWFQTK
jgi:hypothetical protein